MHPADAARYLKTPPATPAGVVRRTPYVTSRGTKHWERLIIPASREPLLLSFWNLVEAHVLWALRVDHRVPIAAVRKALSYAERELGVERLLLRKELCTDQRALFLREYGELIDLSASGQIQEQSTSSPPLDLSNAFELRPRIQLVGV